MKIWAQSDNRFDSPFHPIVKFIKCENHCRSVYSPKQGGFVLLDSSCGLLILVKVFYSSQKCQGSKRIQLLSIYEIELIYFFKCIPYCYCLYLLFHRHWSYDFQRSTNIEQVSERFTI